MKRTFITLLILVIATVGSYATTYYSKATGLQMRVATSWVTNTDGTGSSPANLTTDGDIFIIQNGHEMITGATTVFNATNSTLQILAGGKLTATHAITVTNFIVDNGGVYIHNVAQLFPAVAGTITLNPASTVEIQNYIAPGSNTLPNVIWGNLIINVSIGAEWVINDQSTFETKGNLIIRKTGSVATRIVRLSPNTGALNVAATIGGDLIIEGGILALSANNDVASVNNQYKLWVKGDLIVEDKGTADYNGTTVAELRLSNANPYTAIFSLIVDGDTYIKKGSFIGSNVATNASPNINMDLKNNFTVDTDGIAILSKATTGSGTIKAISMVVGGNMEVNGIFTGTNGTPWTSNYGGATVYFKGGTANNSLKMASGQGAVNIAYIIAKGKTLTLQSNIETNKFIAIAGSVIENGYTIIGGNNIISNAATAFNGSIDANAQSVVTLEDGATATNLGLLLGMEITSLANNILAPNTVITQIIDDNTISISRAAINGVDPYSGAGIYPVNFNIEGVGILPLTLVDFKATREVSGIKLQWKTIQENDVKQMVLERSIDGVTFAKIAALNAYNNVEGHIYSYLDKDASISYNNYYRLRIEDYNGSSTYGKVVVVSPLSTVNIGIKIYPNLVDNYVNIDFPVGSTQGTLRIMAVDGKIIKQKNIFKGQEHVQLSVSQLSEGVYMVIYRDETGRHFSSKFIKK